MLIEYLPAVADETRSLLKEYEHAMFSMRHTDLITARRAGRVDPPPGIAHGHSPANDGIPGWILEKVFSKTRVMIFLETLSPFSHF